MDLPSWVSPTETKPAPGSLLLVQAFVNTWESDTGTDLLCDVSGARQWLSDTGFLPASGRMSEDDLAVARGVRDGLRSLLIQNAGGPTPSPSELTSLRTLARASWMRPGLRADGMVELETESGEGMQLGRLLVVIRDAQRDGTWWRLKACRNPECTWAYYDRSHARRGAWCDMAVCGNRMKNRKMRSRRAGESRPSP